MPDETPGKMTLPCNYCNEFAVISYELRPEPTENMWVCPACGKFSRMVFKGVITGTARRETGI